MSNSTRNYLRDFDYRVYAHTASASQMSAYLTCPRKWWFQKVLRIPDIADQTKFIFGDRLHEACERYLLADETGRDPKTRKPYQLWTKGWDEGLGGYDASILKQLVELGIDEGILRRTPGRRIEAPFFYTIVPNVGICGYRDVAAPGLVEDHKSIKKRRYKSSQADLRDDPQLLIYAAIDIRERMQDGYVPNPTDEITLRHNQFIKDPNDMFVQPCETEVTVAEVMDFWNEHVESAATEMLELKRAKLGPLDWEKVEGPRVKGACQEYGGCPFAGVCGGTLTAQALRARVERINELPVESDEPETTTPGGTMGIFDRMNSPATKPAAATKVREPKPKPAPEPEVVVETIEEPMIEETVIDTSIPPWANPDCKACAGVGFNSKGSVCRACDRVSKKNDGIPSSAYTIAVDDEGYTTWSAADVLVGRVKLTSEPKAGDDTAPKPKTARKPRKTKAEREAEKAAAAEAESPATEVPETVPEDVTAKATTAKPKDTTLVEVEEVKPGRGRPAMGWILVYGAVRRSKFPIVDLNQLFHTYAAQLAEKQGAKSYYELDRFKRADQMKAVAGDVAGFIKAGSVVTVRADDRDIKSFAAAIEIYATIVVEGNG